MFQDFKIKMNLTKISSVLIVMSALGALMSIIMIASFSSLYDAILKKVSTTQLNFRFFFYTQLFIKKNLIHPGKKKFTFQCIKKLYFF